MAKDVIQITDKETGETGNVRDSRLALAKEKTAVALTDAIELRTIDDKQIFVKADSFFNAFAQWCKANNKSTITSLFGELTADGVSSPGSINMANLASVLSAVCPIYDNINAGNLPAGLAYVVNATDISGAHFFVYTMICSYDYRFQFILNISSKDSQPLFYIRHYNNGWSALRTI